MANAILAVISRDEAIKRGLKRYFTGVPCVHGHISERSVGRNNQCFECKRITDARYAERTKPKKAEYDKEYREIHRESIAKKRREWRDENKEDISRRAKEARKSDPDRFRAYKEKRAEIIRTEIKTWRARNKDHVKLYNMAYAREAKEKKSNVWLAAVLRQRLSVAVRGNARAGSAVRDLGCSIEFLKNHLEKAFKPGMNWENWGRKGWHIDHIRPLSSFDLSDKLQVADACHYTNLQPLWAEENLAKGSKVA